MQIATTLPNPTRAQLAAFTLGVGALLALAGIWSQTQLGDRLLPHAFCIAGSQPLFALHLVSDALIFVAYCAIPWTLLNIARRRSDIPFGWVAWLFGAFIIACGATHALEVWTLYYPVYWIAGVAKAFTAAVSLGTAWIMYRLTPAALALPSGAELRSANEALRVAQVRVDDAAAELRRTKEMLQAILTTARDGVIVTDEALQVVLCNDAARRLFAMPADAADTAAGFLDCVEQPQAASEAIRASEAGSAPAKLRVRHRDGRRLVVECTVTRFQLEGKRLSTLVARDITQRDAAEEALVRSNQSLQQFAFIASHDLRSPLRTIGGMLGAVHADLAGKLSAAHEDLFGRVFRAVDHMNRLTTDLLTYARAETGTSSFSPVQLTKVVQSAQDYVRDSLAAAGGTIRCGDLPVVQGDATQLAQLFVNLFDNAVKYRSEAPPAIDVQARATGDGAWQVTVTDNGIGIAPEHQERVFEIFKRLPGRENVQGTGIGLALARRIAERHGGSIHAAAAPSGGTTFTILLPAQ